MPQVIIRVCVWVVIHTLLVACEESLKEYRRILSCFFSSSISTWISGASGGGNIFSGWWPRSPLPIGAIILHIGNMMLMLIKMILKVDISDNFSELWWFRGLRFNDDQARCQVRIIEASNNTASASGELTLNIFQGNRQWESVKPEHGEIVASLVSLSASFILVVDDVLSDVIVNLLQWVWVSSPPKRWN